MQTVTARRATALSACLLLCASGCASSPPRPQPGGGRLTVGVTTAGSARTATFRVTVEPAGITGPVKADAGVFINDDIPPGDHVVRLLDVPAACRIKGGSERKIAITPQRRSAVLRFDVDCGG